MPYNEISRNNFFTKIITNDYRPTIVKNYSYKTALKKFSLKNDYFVIFPGGSWAGRKWPNNNFVELIKKINRRSDLEVVICGSKTEFDDAQYITQKFLNKNVHNFAGKTSLSELFNIISGASFILSNETSAIHIASHTNTQSICILGGGHFGRFLPYPSDFSGPKPIDVYHKMDCYGCNWRCIHRRKKSSPVKCIELISVEDVFQKVINFL